MKLANSMFALLVQEDPDFQNDPFAEAVAPDALEDGIANFPILFGNDKEKEKLQFFSQSWADYERDPDFFFRQTALAVEPEVTKEEFGNQAAVFVEFANRFKLLSALSADTSEEQYGWIEMELGRLQAGWLRFRSTYCRLLCVLLIARVCFENRSVAKKA
jgi:hypothetical protein